MLDNSYTRARTISRVLEALGKMMGIIASIIMMLLIPLHNEGKTEGFERFILTFMSVALVMGFGLVILGKRLIHMRKGQLLWFVVLSVIFDLWFIAIVIVSNWDHWFVAKEIPNQTPKSHITDWIIFIVIVIALVAFEIFAGRRIKSVEKALRRESDEDGGLPAGWERSINE